MMLANSYCLRVTRRCVPLGVHFFVSCCCLDDVKFDPLTLLIHAAWSKSREFLKMKPNSVVFLPPRLG